MEEQKEKNEKRNGIHPLYWIYISESVHLSNCVHQDDHCIKFCGKWIFVSNFEVEFTLTEDVLKYTCTGNDSDEIKFISVCHVIRAVSPRVVQIRKKYEIRVIILICCRCQVRQLIKKVKESILIS